MITGLASHLIRNGIAVLRYADDTIICLTDSMDVARNMKLLLYMYEMMSGLKTKFSKSKIIMIHEDEAKYEQYAEIFNCQIGQSNIWQSR